MVAKFNVARVTTLLAFLVVVIYVTDSEAIPNFFKAKLSCAKDYMMQMVKEKLVGRSTIVREYNYTMSTIKSRYEKAKNDGSLMGMEEAERENYYYKITVEELARLKERIEMGSLKESGFTGEEARAEEKALQTDECYNPDAMVENWNPDTADLDENDELELWTELNDLEEQARRESEMGWAMTAEAKEALRSRTKNVLVDILNNEVRQIASAILTAYLSGGTFGPVLAALSGTLKFKLMEFLMNGILDVVSSALGRRIEITPMTGEVEPGVAPAAVEFKSTEPLAAVAAA